MHSFDLLFSLPREPNTALTPGQEFSLNVPEGKKVIVTDIYIENLGGGRSHLVISEQKGPNSFEVRYTFRTRSKRTTIINFTTGLRLGEEGPIAGTIRIENNINSKANILPRVNGVIVP